MRSQAGPTLGKFSTVKRVSFTRLAWLDPLVQGPGPRPTWGVSGSGVMMSSWLQCSTWSGSAAWCRTHTPCQGGVMVIEDVKHHQGGPCVSLLGRSQEQPATEKVKKSQVMYKPPSFFFFFNKCARQILLCKLGIVPGYSKKNLQNNFLL